MSDGLLVPGPGIPAPGPGDPATAETYPRLIAEAELRQRPVISGPGSHPHRVWVTAGWEPNGYGWLVHGSGPSGEPLDPSLSWRARNSTGRWHLVSGMSWGVVTQTKGMIKMNLAPPLHPEATSLHVILSGPGCQVQATVPLDWGPAR